MSTYDPPTIAELSVNGFSPTGKNGVSAGASILERFREATDDCYERSFQVASDETIDPSPLPVDVSPINPAAFALFGVAGNTGFLGQQFQRRAERDYEVDVERIGSLPSLANLDVIVESPFTANAIPVIQGYVLDSDNASYPVSVEFPCFEYRAKPEAVSLWFVCRVPLANDGENASLDAKFFLLELGADGSGYTGGIVPTPPYDAMPDSDIAGDSKFLAALYRKFRNRLDYIKGALDGQSDAQRIVAQAIPTEVSASGKGLLGKMFNYRKNTFTGTTLAVSASTYLNIGLAASVTLGPLGFPVVTAVTAGANYALRPSYAVKDVAGVPTWHAYVVNNGTGSATFNLDTYLIQY